MRKALVFFLLAASLVYLLWNLAFAPYHVRYKLTVDVDDHGVMRTGSGVVDISYEFPSASIRFPNGPSYFARMEGCAITIDLGSQGLLFVINYPPNLWSPTNHLLYPKASGLTKLPLIAYGYRFEGETSDIEDAVKSLNGKSDPQEVSADRLPAFVHFKNLDEKDTIEEVDPADLGHYGLLGVHFVRAVVELTNDPVSAIPANWPRWLAEQRFMLLDLKHGPPGGASSVDFSAFRGK